MTDIFLSYTEKDREEARRVAAMLESVGWTVWWDRRIPAGETWRGVLEKALEDMRCMIVLWSSRSIESEWVYEEATEGRRLGKLVPVMIEAVRPPAGFREIQAADLTDWDGSREFDGMRMLIADLENILGKPLPAPTGQTGKPVDQAQIPYDPADLAGGKSDSDWWPRRRLAIVATAGVLLLAAGAVYVGLSSREPAVVARPVPEPERQETHTRPLPAEPAPTLETKVPIPVDPAPIPPETTPPPPVAQAPSKPRPPVKRADTTRSTSSRCADLLTRIQLGESLSYEAQAVFQKECQQ